jgi:PAS domain S-box-containing protein
VNFEVVEAATGMTGVAAAVAGVDLVILDVNLPDIDGFEVCRRIRAHPATTRLPVIHLSATFVQDEYKVHGLEVGADGYLTHPVEPPVLVATVNAFLRARRAEDEMRKSEAKFKAVFENALNGIALINQDLVYLDVNPAMCRLLDAERGAIIGRHVAEFVPPDRKATAADIHRELEERGSWRGYLPLVRSDGGIVPLDWSLSIHSLPDVRLAVVTDIADRLTAERERERLLTNERVARAEAERANRLKDDFLATVSHELRTPLSSILLWARLLGSGTVGDGDRHEAIAAIVKGAEAQQQLIDDLLDASRMTSGHLRLDLRVTDPRRPLAAAVALVRPIADAKRVGLDLADDTSAGLIRGDTERLQQVFLNLLTNALKFTPEGGRIEVRLERVPPAGGGPHPLGAVRVAVKDTGKGIGADFLPHVFERFRQADASANRRHAGLGLGLAIVHELVTLHGGTIRADSAGEGKGAEFIVEFPLADAQIDASNVLVDDSGRPALVPATALKSRAALALAGLRVLLVEDDAPTRKALRWVLRASGAWVEEAATAAAALEALGRNGPDVLVSDIGLPGQDGYSLLAEAQALAAAGGTLVPPALAITAFARGEDKRRALAAGFQAYLAKPVEPEEFVAVVTELGRARPGPIVSPGGTPGGGDGTS